MSPLPPIPPPSACPDDGERETSGADAPITCSDSPGKESIPRPPMVERHRPPSTGMRDLRHRRRRFDDGGTGDLKRGCRSSPAAGPQGSAGILVASARSGQRRSRRREEHPMIPEPGPGLVQRRRHPWRPFPDPDRVRPDRDSGPADRPTAPGFGSPRDSGRRDDVGPGAPGSEWESFKWMAGVNAANGCPWDPAMMLVVYGLLRLVGLLLSPLRAIARVARARARKGTLQDRGAQRTPRVRRATTGRPPRHDDTADLRRVDALSRGAR